ncbi:hypothetical protein KW798_03195, partial [Candidatus Parcubacteria bacterium]|nr:hypothetical protein [Candidatus Parcubacteria bacterium]
MKYFVAIGYAIFLDGLQAGLSFALAGLFASPGVIPFVGPLIAAVSIPFGIALGFIINICLSLTMGSGLLLLLVHLCGFKSLQKYIFGSIGDLIPGLNNLPFWTLLTIGVCWNHAKQNGVAWNLSRVVTSGRMVRVREIMDTKEKNMNMPGIKQGVERFGLEQSNRPQPQDVRELEKTSRSR